MTAKKTMIEYDKKDFIEQKKSVKELKIFIDGVYYCAINDDENSASQIEMLSRIFPAKIIRVEKKEVVI